jgi:trehalose 6-phosphate synthase/phosphatase
MRAKYWDGTYRESRFADAVVEEAGADAEEGSDARPYGSRTTTWRSRRRRSCGSADPDLTLAHFWHIPFPPLEIFRVASTRRNCCAACWPMTSSGSTCRCSATTSCAARSRYFDDARVDWDAAHGRARWPPLLCPRVPDLDRRETRSGRPRCTVRPTASKRLRARYAPEDMMLGLGVDRIDYSKGLEEKLKALDLLFDRHPEFRERFTFVQIAVPSRTALTRTTG